MKLVLLYLLYVTYDVPKLLNCSIKSVILQIVQNDNSFFEIALMSSMELQYLHTANRWR